MSSLFSPGNRQLICCRASEKKRQREEASMNREYSALRLLHSHRDSARAGVSPQSGPVKYKPLSSQTLIPTRNTLSIPPRDPFLFYYCIGENAWQESSDQHAAEQYCIVPTQLRCTEEDESSWNHSQHQGLRAIMSLCSARPVPMMNTWIHKHKMGLWISIR